MAKVFVLLTLCLINISSAYVTKKSKTTKLSKIQSSLREQAQFEVNQPVKPQPQLPNQDDQSGVLAIHPTTNDSPLEFRSLPVGISLSYIRTKGQLINKKNTVIDLATTSAPYLADLVFGYKPLNQSLFSFLSLHIGYFRSRESTLDQESVYLTQNNFFLTSYKTLYSKDQWEVGPLGQLGIYQIQISSPENSMLNTSEQCHFFGIGGNLIFKPVPKINLSLTLAKRIKVLSSTEMDFDPLTLTLGAFYLW